MKDPISVTHEWGTLREVIVGRGEGLIVPQYSDKVDFIYDKQFAEMMKECGGRAASEIEPESFKMVIEQIEELVKVLEEKGVKVHRPRILSESEAKYLSDIQKGQMQIYARDPMLVIGNLAIETALKVPMRTKEKFPLREIIRDRVDGSDSRYVAMPAPHPDFGEDGIYIEGGDVLLNGSEIYVGNSGKASNPAGMAWLQRVLGDGYTVREIKVSPEFEHLDCIMALLRPGLGLLCRDGLKSELPDSLQNWDFINVTIEEAKNLGANALVLDPETVIMDSQHQRIIEEVRKRDHNVIEVPYDKVSTWGGAFRCSHHPLVRLTPEK